MIPQIAPDEVFIQLSLISEGLLSDLTAKAFDVKSIQRLV